MGNKVFIGGISYSTTEKQLHEALSVHGKVLALRIVVDRETGKSKGFGFATFETKEEADMAIEKLDNTPLDGRRIGVKPSINQ